jgi:hypothetical protein
MIDAISNGVCHALVGGDCFLPVNGSQSHAAEQAGRANIEQEISNLVITNTTGVTAGSNLIHSDHGANDRQGHSDADMADNAEPSVACEFKIPDIHMARLDRKAYPDGIGAKLLEISEQCEVRSQICVYPFSCREY